MKKIIALLMVLVMVFSLAACGNSNNTTNPTTGNNNNDPKPTNGNNQGNNSQLAGTYDAKIWVAEEIKELTEQQIANFNATNGQGITINATVEAVGEGDAATAMTTDVEAGADIFCFAQDQAARLIQAGALAQLGVKAAELVSTSNDAGTVAAVTSGENLWAYPLTADNGYFMYYDKSVISDDIIDSLEDIIAACEASGTNLSFELENSWYIVSFFFATGCDSTWETDGDGNFIKVNDTFNSAKGLLACEGLSKVVTSKSYVNSSQASDFEATVPSSVVVSGTWNYETAKNILGENFGVADLPSFTASNGETYHLASYNGCKLMGVKPQTDAVKAAVMHLLAQYLTNETCQLERFEAKGWGPSNLAAQTNEKVSTSEHLTALWAQNKYSVPQGQIHGSWWDIAKVIATSLKDGMEAQTALDNYVASMNALFEMSQEELTAWAVIGNICGTNWDADLPMTEENGIWKSEALELHAGEEFKVRQGKSWDNNYGADGAAGGANVVVEADGTYYVVFDSATGMITLEAAN